MTAPCVFHCLNIKLADEWLKTCNEYLGYVRRPFQSVPASQLWKCRQSNWADAFKEWGVLQFYMGVVTAILMAVIIALEDGSNIVGVVIDLIVRIVVCYILAHLSWFAVVRKNGCFCCVVACCECPPLLLLWGVLSMVWAVLGMVDSLTHLGGCVVCIAGPIVQAIYCIILFYMGLCCVMLWVQHGSEILPPVFQARGPDGQTVGSAQGV
mmetsp:Transcript_183442/g.581830  ORF Transcript_183442/g.581830 Transcript_183442/m.581830 type:complete len:210 (-) Transcript_183442:119-748(-)|eukprot:CAMPEP_0203859108 /NCGR_PEP_ID=MMETSP0359-20131031/11651_1 /ASSEMBLY_ACC=CAM_ASM_000338 /TAXON_ID=268821 /ORGANISM="Scrippsiella Hangoei, Strain SHTV-5" /LENGTH=209 /DNA_ID=CAMNT_0050775959 /DNA_START=85 /DNA_END=714 /DNA_ORIENTATION=+